MIDVSTSRVWWSCGTTGLAGYTGTADGGGIHIRRHWGYCRDGLWLVLVLGWDVFANAVVDDFGNLVKVP